MEEVYVVLCWPETQDIMDKAWFNECELINSEYGQDRYGSSAYLVPMERFKELSNS